MFDVFDYDGVITRTAVTSGYTDTNGDWVPESTSSTTITGHVTDLTLQDLQYIDAGLIERGTRKLATTDTLEVGDRITIDSVDYDVVQKINTNNLIEKYTGESRSTYLIAHR
ncbi:hypothetical protein [Methanococcoides sp. AM1]|uniref:hypothetical protein n=1 Tax=Methanococcoides sp. AM1 TaxID=1201011 RepID=UPI00108422A3|nr:hypothetical protein [Methanococcoides sp. AM1]